MQSGYYSEALVPTPLLLSNAVRFGEISPDGKTVTVSLNLDACDIDDLTLFVDVMRDFKTAQDEGTCIVEEFKFLQHDRSFESADNAFEFVFTQCQSRYDVEYSDDDAPQP